MTNIPNPETPVLVRGCGDVARICWVLRIDVNVVYVTDKQDVIDMRHGA